ncbi:hypothetical protein IID04_07600, partial [PVC group bacterium]|nr:hypothetical protein [PVC group bacterium]
SYTAGELYRKPEGDCPDLFVYLDDLSWRSAGTVGHHKLYLGQNDTGPDDAVHDWDGIFIAWRANHKFRSLPQRIFNQDFAPSVLSLFGEKPPRQMKGENRLRRKRAK